MLIKCDHKNYLNCIVFYFFYYEWWDKVVIFLSVENKSIYFSDFWVTVNTPLAQIIKMAHLLFY